MKRFWTAIVLLVCVLAGGLYNLYAVSRTVNHLSATFTQAEYAAQSDDLTAAGQLTAQAQSDYKRCEPYLSAVISEKLLDEVRLGFARTAAGAQTGDSAQFLLELAGLRQAVDDLLRSEVIDLKNIF